MTLGYRNPTRCEWERITPTRAIIMCRVALRRTNLTRYGDERPKAPKEGGVGSKCPDAPE